MLLVDKKTRELRLDTCRMCPHFVAMTQSCGPLVTEAFTSSKLCGCHMPTKVKLKVAKCPHDKWGATVTTDDLERVRHMLDNKREYTNQDLVDLYNKLTGAHRQRTTCTSCNNSMVKELRRLLNAFDDEN